MIAASKKGAYALSLKPPEDGSKRYRTISTQYAEILEDIQNGKIVEVSKKGLSTYLQTCLRRQKIKAIVRRKGDIYTMKRI